MTEDLIYSFIELAVQIEVENGNDEGENKIVNQINCKLGTQFKSIYDIRSGSIHDNQFKTNLGECAKKSGWFKSISKGKKLGGFIFQHLNELTGTELKLVIQQLSLWLYGK